MTSAPSSTNLPTSKTRPDTCWSDWSGSDVKGAAGLRRRAAEEPYAAVQVLWFKSEAK